jgi:hypothetical protein
MSLKKYIDNSFEKDYLKDLSTVGQFIWETLLKRINKDNSFEKHYFKELTRTINLRNITKKN